MKTEFDTMRKKVDDCLVNALKENNECGILAFSCLLKKVFSLLNIGIASFEGDDRLTVYGEDALAKIHAIYFYLMELEKNNYLLYVDLPAIVNSIDFGETCQNSSGKLSKSLSSFILKHSGENVCISPLINDYIEANHCTPELHEARVQRKTAIIATVLSGIAVLIAVISTTLSIVSIFLPHCCH